MTHYHKREFFWINVEATGNADLAEQEQNVTLPERRHNSGDEIGRSDTIKGSKQLRRKERSGAGGKESGKVESMDVLSTSKRRREKDRTEETTM
jgi:hypothetical protein